MTVDTSRPEDRGGHGSDAASIAGLTTAHAQQPAPGIYPVPGLDDGGAHVPGSDAPGGSRASSGSRAPGGSHAPGVPRATPAAQRSAVTLATVGAQRLRATASGQRLTGLLGDSERLAEAVGERFRLPDADDPAPRNRQLAGVCAWAAALGLGGIAVAVRALVGLMTVGASWYGPTVVIIGLVGLLCTVGAFASVHRRRLPWTMLGSATFALVTDWIITGAVS